MSRQEWVLKRNCSISPRQLAGVYAVLCGMSLIVAVLFTLRGAWYVLGFAMLEMSVVGGAFLLYARHATDREHIALIDGCLLVELIQAGRVCRFRLIPHCTRVNLPVAQNRVIGLVSLESNGVRVEVGRFLTEWERHRLVQELQHALQYG
jgi:uncharacterized membrane protein